MYILEYSKDRIFVLTYDDDALVFDNGLNPVVTNNRNIVEQKTKPSQTAYRPLLYNSHQQNFKVY